MTIALQPIKFRYQGNGATASFSFANKIYDETDLIVEILDRTTSALIETLTYVTHYSVSIAANGYATVTITNPAKIPSNTQDILLRASFPFTQTAEFNSGTVLPAETIENMGDKLTSIVQQLDESVGRSLKYNAQSPVTNPTIANPVADATLAFDGTTGALKAGATLGDISNAAANATAAAASAATASAASAAAQAAASVFNPLLNNFRLTPTSGVPVVTGDANAVTTLYMTPYNGNQIALYDGAKWNVRTSAEISISLASTSANNAYDVFCYDNAGTPTLELQVWSTATARSVALVYQNGVLVKSGATTRRYLGSFYCHTNGQTASSLTNTGATTGRYIFNYYNRVLLRMQRFESTASWAYNVNAYRQANGSTVNQLNFFVGVVKDAVACSQTGQAGLTTVNAGALTGIGLNSTTVAQTASFLNSQVTTYQSGGSSTIFLVPSLGLNYLSWIEYGNTGGATFYSNGTNGINGAIFC